VSAVTTPPLPPVGPADLPAAEPPRPRWWLAKRVLLGGLGVVLLSGAGTAVFALNEVDKVVEALGQNRPVKIAPKLLAPTSRGAPETLLLVGNDERPPPKSNPFGSVLPHSNEMLLVRIDPSRPTISMLSIPRELQVAITPPGGQVVVNRINVAYTIGGIQLMTETIKRVLGVAVNHVFVVTFPKFKRAVNEMGCVYMTVDRRYYHVNEPGSEQYFEINLQPGYQRLCGKQALEFVANRHEDTSLTRDARDQRFLLEVKAQYGASLFENRDKFERILGRAVETDLHGSGQVLDLLELLVESQGKPVRQVPFQVNLLPSYDTASPQQIQESVRSFLGGTALLPKRKLNDAVRASGARPHRHESPPALALTPTPSSELAHARSAAPSLPIPLEYPRARDTYAGAVPDTLRLYDIRDQRGHLEPSYAIVVDHGPLGQFFDVEGTAWSDPPLLNNPSETVRIGSRSYELFYAGEQIRTIAWHEGNGTYWIQNTLTNSVAPREMLAMAVETVPVISGAPTGTVPVTAVPHNLNLPPRTAAVTSTTTKVGAILGLASIASLLALALAVLSRQRQLGALREQVAYAITLEARQRPLLAASAGASAISRTRTPTVYRAPRRLRKGVTATGLALALAALAAVGVHVLSNGSSPAPARGAQVPVAVFNATSTPGAAHKIAATLEADHVHVGKLGDIKNAGLGHGAYVLYPPGTEGQARHVAQALAALSPTVAPIQPQVQNAVAQRDEIVIVVD
jgi:polyisoprenyl-teichoic acid--peptidoglycan teichoic acid transferase